MKYDIHNVSCLTKDMFVIFLKLAVFINVFM